jgi:hypothetical protein
MEATMHQPSTAEPSRITIDDGQLGQLAYHIRWSASLAASGQTVSAAHHAIIAGAMLDVIGGDALRVASSALDLPEVLAATSPSDVEAQRAAATQLSYQFVSHFTSDGRHDLADLYLETTRRIRGES